MRTVIFKIDLLRHSLDNGRNFSGEYSMRHVPAALVLTLAITGCSQTQVGDTTVAESSSISTGSTSRAAADENKAAQVPKCPQPLATLALEDRQIAVLSTFGLSSPVPVLQSFVSESGCFQVVDANAAAIAARHGGRRKAVVPDYVLTADILSQNPNAGGASVNVGSFLPGAAGQVLQNVSFNTSEVKTTLTLADTRTGLQVAHVNGMAQTTDVGASFGGFGRHGGMSFGAYADTPIGRTTSAALLDAYAKLVRHVQAMPKRVASAARR